MVDPDPDGPFSVEALTDPDSVMYTSDKELVAVERTTMSVDALG
jgi:hypothetical protein